MSNQSGNILIALLAGAIVGAGIGILLAPDKGENTRKKIKEGMDFSSDDILDKLKSISDLLLEKASETKATFEEMLEDKGTQAHEDKEALIALLEQKLAALKTEK